MRWGRCEPTQREMRQTAERERLCVWTLSRCWLSLRVTRTFCTKSERLNARRQLLVALAEWLCEHHRRDARAGRIVSDMHLHLLPTMNPDGCACRFHSCKYCAQRSYCLSPKLLCWQPDRKRRP